YSHTTSHITSHQLSNTDIYQREIRNFAKSSPPFSHYPLLHAFHNQIPGIFRSIGKQRLLQKRDTPRKARRAMPSKLFYKWVRVLFKILDRIHRSIDWWMWLILFLQEKNSGLGKNGSTYIHTYIQHTGEIIQSVGMAYKQMGLYRVDHKCGICKTVLSSPRAKKTCIGVHEEVCPKFHFTLFYVGMGIAFFIIIVLGVMWWIGGLADYIVGFFSLPHRKHKCRKSVELHDKRHRDIACLAAEIIRYDDASKMMLGTRKASKKKAMRSDGLLPFKSDGLPVEVSGDESTDWEYGSSLAEDDVRATQPRIGPVDDSEPRKLAKANRKTVKGHGSVQVITSECLKVIDELLHPESYVSDDPIHQTTKAINGESVVSASGSIQKNLALSTNCLKASARSHIIRANKLAKENRERKRPPPQDAQEDTLVATLLEEFGIRASLPHATKERNNMVGRLRVLIQNDLISVDNEDRETMTRMAGYWRYVNRKTYNYMVRHRLLWDWETGGKLEEVSVEEESDLDVGDDCSITAPTGMFPDRQTDIDGAKPKLEDATKDPISEASTRQLTFPGRDTRSDTERYTKKPTVLEPGGAFQNCINPDPSLKKSVMSESVYTMDNRESRLRHSKEDHYRIESNSLAAHISSEDNRPCPMDNQQLSSTSVAAVVSARLYKDHNNFYYPLVNQNTLRPIRSLRLTMPATPKALVAQPDSGWETKERGGSIANKAFPRERGKMSCGAVAVGKET
ncbi:MAG: hypothetical protein Q9214_000245, partial [Letrouitia sp. 1 TL-2023]